ncbi:EamA family transporter [Kribbella sp. NPDC050281]|uniref:EamA family transporter n=1 Tax=Kribbella sp. NPDC050281 TaxID=3155515 RepID=UPI0033FE0A82
MSTRESRTGVAFAVMSMSCVQLGLSVSVSLFDRLGPEGAAWLRLSFAAVIVLVLFRPRLRSFDRRSLLAAVGLGIATAGVTLLFMAAAARIPLGVASALEFLGPLSVAVVRNARQPSAVRIPGLRGLGGRRAGLVWPALAFVGVMLLTQPWRFVGGSASSAHGSAGGVPVGGSLDVLGVLFALGAAVCWAAYILLTQHVGDNVSGLQGLGVSIPVAAVVATVVAGPSTIPLMTWDLVAIGFGLALLLPVIPFTLEYLALRRLDAGVFGTLMSLEPALALLVGWLILHQMPGLLPVFGIAFVVLAGMGAERTSAPHRPSRPQSTEQPGVLSPG